MAERLPVIRLQPECIVEWGAFVGASREVLAQAYPRARLLAVEADGARRDATVAARQAPWWQPRRWAAAEPQALTEAQLQPGQGQLLWANMALHVAADPQAVMRHWHRATAVDGFLMFSTLGPGSMPTLRALYAAQGWPPPFAPFVDMHDLGDMLIEAGFADPVMDQEQITLTWATPTALLAELRQLGGNADPRRSAGLRTPRWRDRLLALLQAQADPAGRVALGFEVVYGHAFRPAPRPRLAARTEVPLDDLRAMVRAGRPRG
jgi:malonyl-CoA O-methyltransferase